LAASEVVITGAGVVSPIGVGVEAYADSLQRQASGVRRIDLFDPCALPADFAGQVPDFDAKGFVQKRKSLKVMNRDIQLAYAAAKLAVGHANVEAGKSVDPDRLGVVFGADMLYSELADLWPAMTGCIEDGKYIHDRWADAAMSDLNPLWMLKYLPNMLACHIGISQDARGPNNTITLGEVSSLLALGEAMRVIGRGAADVMIAGGGSSRIHPTPLLTRRVNLSLRRDNPAAACRPFDAQRDGQVHGEGAAAIILERREHAEARGAKIMARLIACHSRMEPKLPDAPSSGSAIRAALTAALDSAGISAAEVGHVNAHGVSIVDQDRVEAAAIRDVLGEVPVTAPKSFFGNSGAGCGAVELVASLIALEEGKIPVTLNYETPDPQCPVNVVHGEPMPSDKRTAVALNFATTGQAVAAVLVGP